MTITELRVERGLSQSQFAKRIGIPVGTLQNWEQGKRTPPSYVLDLVERVLRAEEEGIVTCSDCVEWGNNTSPTMACGKFCSVAKKYTDKDYFCGDAERKVDL